MLLLVGFVARFYFILQHELQQQEPQQQEPQQQDLKVLAVLVGQQQQLERGQTLDLTRQAQGQGAGGVGRGREVRGGGSGADGGRADGDRIHSLHWRWWGRGGCVPRGRGLRGSSFPHSALG